MRGHFRKFACLRPLSALVVWVLVREIWVLLFDTGRVAGIYRVSLIYFRSGGSEYFVHDFFVVLGIYR